MNCKLFESTDFYVPKFIRIIAAVKERMKKMTTQLNDSQLHLLKLLSFAKRQADLDEMTQVLIDYYSKKLKKDTDALWASGKLNDELMEEILNSHIRTPYHQ